MTALSPSQKMFTTHRVFVHHAASLRQTFVHCGRFSTAATRRCMGRVSVPSVGVTLSGPLAVLALVSHYLTNKLIARRPFPKRITALIRRYYRVLVRLSANYSRLGSRFLRVTTSSATDSQRVLLHKVNPFDLHALSTPPAFILS